MSGKFQDAVVWSRHLEDTKMENDVMIQMAEACLGLETALSG